MAHRNERVLIFKGDNDLAYSVLSRKVAVCLYDIGHIKGRYGRRFDLACTIEFHNLTAQSVKRQVSPLPLNRRLDQCLETNLSQTWR